jgi:glutamate-1-semialdehyde 2,1-aminomutase
MADICGTPMLIRVMERVKKVTCLDLAVVATSLAQEDNDIALLCEKNRIACFRGDLHDVLDRYYKAACQCSADVIVRITADCPLIDYQVIDKVIETFSTGNFDYVSNTIQYTYPDGLDAEVFSIETLERAWREARLTSEREHVTPYIYNHPEFFRLNNVSNAVDCSSLRWTVDEARDLDFVRAVYSHLNSSEFCFDDIIHLIEEFPELGVINSGIMRNEGYIKSLQQDVAKPNESELKSPGKGQILYARARKLVPGGTQLLSKRPEMFLPEQWPSYFSRASGVNVWDLDGRKYIDMCYNGIGACILGAADPDVDAAVKAAIASGIMSTLNCPEEVELAELLCELHPWADMVRYTRSGGEAMAVAVRIARAHTKRDRVAFCGYHGWHDWYLAANLAEDNALDGHLLSGLQPSGVPRGLLNTALPFRYNHLEDLKTIVSQNRHDLAAIVVETIRNQDPLPGFLDGIRDIADHIKAVLIVDEISSGFRLNTGGAHLLFGLQPDIAVFAKAISNGYPMAAIIGQEAVMQAAQTSFISSTYWTDRIGPTAAIATIRKHKEYDVGKHLIFMGKRIQDGWKLSAGKHGLDIDIAGIPPLSHFSINCANPSVAHTLFTQMMLEKGILAAKGFYATYAHQSTHIEEYLRAVDDAFLFIGQSIKNGSIFDHLKGPVAQTGFQRLT